VKLNYRDFRTLYYTSRAFYIVCWKTLKSVKPIERQRKKGVQAVYKALRAKFFTVSHPDFASFLLNSRDRAIGMSKTAIGIAK